MNALTKSDETRLEALAWVERLRSGDVTHADVQCLEVWRAGSGARRQAFAEAVALCDLVRDAAPDFRFLAAEDRFGASSAVRGLFSRRVFWGGAAASAAGLAAYAAISPPLSLWPSVGQLAVSFNADYATEKGERRRVIVGSTAVELNTQTSLKVAHVAAMAGAKLLDGEVAVRTARPFYVSAGAARIVAESASLNVRLDGTAVCVSCQSGAVRILHPIARLTLVSGSQVNFNSQRIDQPHTVDLDATLAWQRGMLVFHHQPLSHVVAEVNRYRKGRIVLLNKELAQRLVYADFHLDHLDGILDQLQEFSGAQIVRLGDVALLS